MKLTFVFPCLNEEETLASCVVAVRKSIESVTDDYEVVVADNGSTDRSREIAEEEGCRVVPVPVRGYGAALRGGIEAAEGEYVMFADADMTYQYEDAGPLYEAAIKNDVDMSIASRMKGTIEAGAMPFLHRYAGTPVLTTLINWLFKGKLSDCNSGFRCIRKTAYAEWGIRASGMEFASELLIKALKARATTVEIKSGLRKGPEGRVAHLRTWRDGMRHLLFIFSEKPGLFTWLGGFVLLLASGLQMASAFTGPLAVGGLNVFDVHSQALLLLAAIVGGQFYLFGCSLFSQRGETAKGLTRTLVELDEGVLFFLLVALLGGISTVVGVLLVVWAKSSFGGLDLANRLMVWVHFLAIPLMLTVG
ncbi:MAG: glycosyltransferase family 2 protein, partial [Verrucomicrobiales bacterium]|nr:glycosyltransferase family 2 protein [Verrucomicrobiales bacterium]